VPVKPPLATTGLTVTQHGRARSSDATGTGGT
jgi:hypothetical protein